jgi:hypothetical protein
MKSGVEARVLAEYGPEQGGQIIALAHAFMGRPSSAAEPEAAPPAPAGEVALTLTQSEAALAGGTKSAAVNAKLIREACAGLDEKAARETVELLKQLSPRDVREALVIRRLVMLDALTVETVGLARTAAHPLLRDAYARQAVALSDAATRLDEALERKRRGKPEQRVVVQYIRGGQAVGMVNQAPSAR